MQRQVPTVQNCAVLRRNSSGAALGPGRHALYCATPGAPSVCQGRRHLCRRAEAVCPGIPQITWRFSSCSSSSSYSLDKVVDMPVVSNDRYFVFFFKSRKLWRFRSCSARIRWSMSLLAQFMDGCGRPCDHTETVCLATWRCLRFNSSRRLRTFQLCNRDGYSVMHWVAVNGGYGGDEGVFGGIRRF